MVEYRNNQGKQDAFSSRYQLGVKVQNGQNEGSLRECIDINTGKKWMVELINKKVVGPAVVRKVERDFEAQKKMEHPNLVRQHELIETGGYLYVVKELCMAPSLFEFLLNKPVMLESDAADLIKQLLSCLNYCHSRNVIHRSLSQDSILYDKGTLSGTVKLINFGESADYNP
jgi:serine/threonine protein kinase